MCVKQKIINITCCTTLVSPGDKTWTCN